jgi:hypothetical protein
LVYFIAIVEYFSLFGMSYHEKSGNPADIARLIYLNRRMALGMD